METCGGRPHSSVMIPILCRYYHTLIQSNFRILGGDGTSCIQMYIVTHVVTLTHIEPYMNIHVYGWRPVYAEAWKENYIYNKTRWVCFSLLFTYLLDRFYPWNNKASGHKWIILYKRLLSEPGHMIPNFIRDISKIPLTTTIMIMKMMMIMTTMTSFYHLHCSCSFILIPKYRIE